MMGVKKEIALFNKESFGPLASLYTFKDDAKAITITNNSEYSLNTSIHTTNIERVINIVREIDVG